MAEKKPFPFITIVKWIASIIGFVGVFGFMFKASVEWGAFKQNQTEVNFDSSAQKNDHINHVKEVPNVVENYKAMQQNIEIAQKLDTALVWVQGVTKNYVEQQKLDSINKSDAITSRAKRDSLRLVDVQENEQTKKDVSRIENAVQLILSNQQKILDTFR